MKEIRARSITLTAGKFAGIFLCVFLTSCLNDNGGKSGSANQTKIKFEEMYEILEGSSLQVEPRINVDSTLTYSLDWEIASEDENEGVIEFSTKENAAIFETWAVTEDVEVLFTVTITDSKGQTDTADFTVIVKDEGVKTIKKALKNLERTKVFPKLDMSETLGGTDEDNDGIRDDIGEYISNLKAVDNDQRNVIFESAKTFQKITLADLFDEQKLNSIGNESALNAVCLALFFDNATDAKRHLKRIEIFTMNTDARAKKYKAYNTARDGSVIRLPEFSDCKKGGQNEM